MKTEEIGCGLVTLMKVDSLTLSAPGQEKQWPRRAMAILAMLGRGMAILAMRGHGQDARGTKPGTGRMPVALCPRHST